ncbi:hypothetical protein PSH70_10805 [Pseudomonas fluorescens]|uniref:hypothetical protein n=1 Tax=Pseudomonas fluorescens TaxID=294 RepID=UPI002738A413|nr:hypothetical protein [Pseudomonas fluorescens]WLH75928.1 hypothetical protein PSH70_10805 [Pseudomonas fluorescens]
MNYFDEELIKDLKKLNITFSILSEAEHNAIVNSINETMPFSGSQIAWSKLKNSINFGFEASNLAISLLTEEINKKTNRKLYFVGDACSEGYSIGPEKLGEALKILSELPQHTYIIPEPMTWIACLSFEGHIDFAAIHA